MKVFTSNPFVSPRRTNKGKFKVLRNLMKFRESLPMVYFACCWDIHDTKRHIELWLSSLIFPPASISLRYFPFYKSGDLLLHRAPSFWSRRWDSRQEYRHKTCLFRCPRESNVCLYINRKEVLTGDIFQRWPQHLPTSMSSTLIGNVTILPLKNGIHLFPLNLNQLITNSSYRLWQKWHYDF